MLTKCFESGEDQYLAILDHRNTPSQGHEESPAQRLFDRRTMTKLPTTSKLLEPRSKDLQQSKHKHKKHQEYQYYNRGAKDLSVLHEGQVVRMKPYRLGSKVWEKGVVLRRLDERSYDVLADNGISYRRNKVQLKPSSEKLEAFETLPRPNVCTPGDECDDKPMRPCELQSECCETQKSCSPVDNLSHNDVKDGKSSPISRERHVMNEKQNTETKAHIKPKASFDTPAKTRSGRIVRRPKYLKEFQLLK